MRLPVTILPLFLLLLLGGCKKEEAETPGSGDQVTACRAVVEAFAGELQEELQSALASGGPVEAISVCKIKAPAIAARLSEEKGWRIARTSLKLRNPANAPDAWERGILESLDQIGDAVGPGAQESFEFRDDSFRYMKAIPVKAACLLCHGENLAPDLVEVLDRQYPNDQARGYRLGQVRGAFTITIPR